MSSRPHLFAVSYAIIGHIVVMQLLVCVYQLSWLKMGDKQLQELKNGQGGTVGHIVTGSGCQTHVLR